MYFDYSVASLQRQVTYLHSGFGGLGYGHLGCLSESRSNPAGLSALGCLWGVGYRIQSGSHRDSLSVPHPSHLLPVNQSHLKECQGQERVARSSKRTA